MKILDHDGLKARGIPHSKVQLWRLVRAGKFPAPIKIGQNRNGWVDTEIDRYIEERVAERDSKMGAA